MLNGAEKAVLFLLSLDEETARPIVAELSETDLRKLRAVASTMRQVPADALDATYADFIERSEVSVAVPRGGLPYLRRLSAGALGEETAQQVFEDGTTSPLTRLERAAPDSIANLLANEPPQIAAAMLAALSPKVSAGVLAALPADRQSFVVAYVSRMTELPARVLEDIASAMLKELPGSLSSTSVSVDGVSRAAQILNAIGRESSTLILTALNEEDTAVATQIRQAMFTFDDLRNVPPKSMRDILREIATERLTIALKDAPEDVMNAIFAGLSQRAADLIRDDLQLLGKVRRSEVETARREIAEVALRLESDGQIDLGRESE